MANLVELGIQYFNDPVRGRPIYRGYIYVGEPDTDPEDIPSNLKDISVITADGTTLAVSQPLRTNTGGNPTYNGEPVKIVTDGAYSLLVQDLAQRDKFYIRNSSEGELDSGILSFDTRADMTTYSSSVGATDGQAVFLAETPREGLFVYRAGDFTAEFASDPQQGVYVPATNGAWVRDYEQLWFQYFGLLPSNTAADNKAIIDGAIGFAESLTEGEDIYAQAELYPTAGGHQILNCRVVGKGMQKTVWLFDGSNDECFVVGGSTLSAFSDGAGIEQCTVKRESIGDKIGFRYSLCSHAKVYDCEAEDFDAATGIGHCWQNENNAWTESGWYLRLKATNCFRSYKHRQTPSGTPGTASQAYNRLSGTVSSMPVGGIGWEIDDGISWYGTDTDLNIYMDGDAATIGFNLNGVLQHGRLRLAGEKPAGGSHSCLTFGSTAVFREMEVHAIFENGAVDIDWNNATIANNNGIIASTGANSYTTFGTNYALAARLAASTSINAATWTTLTNWTEELERPSGAGNNFDNGVFTSQQEGIYNFRAVGCFTPAIGDRCAIRVLTNTRGYVVAQDIGETTDDLVLSGAVSIYLDVGDTAEFQVYNTNADTIRASDADGSKTLFGFEYVAR